MKFFFQTVLRFSLHGNNHFNGIYKSDKMVNTTKVDEIPLKLDCIDGGTVNRTKQPVLFSSALMVVPGKSRIERLKVEI